MRKPSSTRLSILIIMITAATLLPSNLMGSALAAKSGSKSESASAAWVVDGAPLSRECTSGGDSPLNLNDSIVDSSNAYVWIKSSGDSVDRLEDIQFTAKHGSTLVASGDLDFVGGYPAIQCGQFVLLGFDTDDDGSWPDGYTGGTVSDRWTDDLAFAGSVTFKFTYLGKAYSGDSVQFTN